jgi:cyclopropane fatty-acyl-phospholipid synthase-like methyltransferase
MSLTAELQPDQQPGRWDDHVAVYEQVFEPLSAAFATRTFEFLDLRPGARLIDVGAGAGAAALMAASRGANVLAIDVSPAMAARIAARAKDAAMADRVHACVMDGMTLGLPGARFDAAISIFGVILFPDAAAGMREIARVLKPGGRAAIVTWTETERYELAARLLAAIAAIRGPQAPPASLPAQLRFRDEPVFRNLLTAARLDVKTVVRMEEQWRLPSARWIADHIAFAPGMAAMIDMLGADRTAVLEQFVATLEMDKGGNEVLLSAIAHAAIAVKPRMQ